HVQGRRPPPRGDRRVSPVPRPASRRRRCVQCARRHLLLAGGVAAHSVIWSVSVDLDGLGCYAAIHGLSLRLHDRAQRAVPERAIEDACGRRPRGFRAPGYTLSPALLDAVRDRGYAYDSSLLPSPPYYALKAAALLAYALRGRKSQSILGGVGQLFAPRGPHR